MPAKPKFPRKLHSFLGAVKSANVGWSEDGSSVDVRPKALNTDDIFKNHFFSRKTFLYQLKTYGFIRKKVVHSSSC